MKHATWVAVAVLLAVTGTACQDNWMSFFIRDNKRSGEPPDCAPATDETAESLLGGVLDVSLRHSYNANLYTENALISREDPGTPRAETNGIIVQGVYLYFEPDPNVRVDYPPVEFRLSAYIDPQGTYTIGLPIIPAETGEQMEAALTASGRSSMIVTVTAQFYGVTQAGMSVLTQEFQYPVQVCYGCLAACPNDTVPATAECDCPAGGSDEEAPCFPGQDDVVDMCTL